MRFLVSELFFVELINSWAKRGQGCKRQRPGSRLTPAQVAMASSAVVFGAGLAVGAAGAAFLTRRPAHSDRGAQPTPAPSTALSRRDEPVYALSDELKFGHPGELLCRIMLTERKLILGRQLIGPVSDFFRRQAYAAAYDRRLRNPAWVRLPTLVFSASRDSDC